MVQDVLQAYVVQMLPQAKRSAFKGVEVDEIQEIYKAVLDQMKKWIQKIV